MNFLQKRRGIIILLILCLGVGLYVVQNNDMSVSVALREGCDRLNQGISSQFLHPGREEYHQFNDHTGSRIVFEEYSQDEELTTTALLVTDYYVVNDKMPNNFGMDAILNSLFSVEFGLEYTTFSDNSFELLEVEVMPKAKEELTSLSNIIITTESLGLKQYGEPINGTLQMKLESGSWGIIYFFDWNYELVIDKNNHISLKLLGI